MHIDKPPLTFTIVTPTRNSETYLCSTIESILSQTGYFFIDYIVVDGNSTDSTIKILNDYQTRLKSNLINIGCLGISLRYITEHDSGMYDAIKKGFSVAQGDIYAWINADDTYLPNAFQYIADAFQNHPMISWLKGVTTYTHEATDTITQGRCNLYYRAWIRQGIYGRYSYFIQQDSVFWRASLWKQSGGCDPNLKLAGDFDLWRRFAQYAEIYSLPIPVSNFRVHSGQLSEDINGYLDEANLSAPPCKIIGRIIRAYFNNEQKIPAFLRQPIFRILFGDHIYRALIRTQSEGKFQVIQGSYYQVKNELATYAKLR